MSEPPNPGSRPLRRLSAPLPPAAPAGGDRMSFETRPTSRAPATGPLPTRAPQAPGPSLDDRANAGLKEFRAAEMVGLAKLPAAQRPLYQQLTQALAGLPQARLGLSYLVVTGQLTGTTRSADGKDLLTTLLDATRAPLVAGIDRMQLLDELIKDVARPTIIAQGARRERAAIAVQLRLATRLPAEYVRLVVGLASPEGRVKLASGTMAFRAPGSEKPGVKDLAIPARLLQGYLARLRPPGTQPFNARPPATGTGRLPGARP